MTPEGHARQIGPAPAGRSVPSSSVGLTAIFISTFFELVGYFMLGPLMLLRLKSADVSTSMAGLFAATGTIGIFLMTPYASAVTQRLGRRPTLWLSAALPVFSSMGFVLSDSLPLWYLMILISGMAGGLRWVLAEALVAEFSSAQHRGRNIGIFETMIGLTFVIGPALLAWMGASHPAAIWVALGFLVAGFLATLPMPSLPSEPDADKVRVGLHGVWLALCAHPVIMLAGFAGGFFESGISNILPLYGLMLGWSASMAALLLAASGLGSAMLMIPAGMLADRWANPAQGRRSMMVVCAGVTLLSTLAIPLVAGYSWLAWPLAFLWGGAGGCLYTLAMIDIGSRETGITLVNSTAVLVLSYTLGSVAASSGGSALLQFAPAYGFPALLILVAAIGFLTLMKTRYQTSI